MKQPVAKSAGGRASLRDGMLCAALVGLAILATWPVAEIGINDDWSYIRTTQIFAQTHHFVYNGWSTAMLGWQVIWGAVFAWLFGPSHTAIRLSIVPITLATALLYHAILRRFGLNRAHAVFGTLVLTLSPLFLALADTFMTDVTGLFSSLLCLYLCQRAIAATEDRHAAMWLVFAGLTNILTGTARQVAWLGVLVMVPCCGWLLRRRRFIVPATIVTWLVGALSIHWLMAWFARQPYSILVPMFPEQINLHTLDRIVVPIWRSSMSTLLFVLPVLVAFAAAVWPPRRSRLIRWIAVLALLSALYLGLSSKGRGDVIAYPWLTGNIITAHGVMQDPPLFGSERQVPIGWELALAAVFYLCLLGWIDAMRSFPRREDDLAERENRRSMSVLLLPTLLAYMALLLPFAIRLVIFDRYILFILTVVLIFLLRAHQDRIGARIPAIAVVALAMVALLGIAAVHDLFAIDRAEVRLVGELQKAGIPRIQIRGGFDFDSITEVDTAGFLNDPHLTNPPNSYHAHLGTPDQFLPCGYPYLRYVPLLHIKYVISADPTPCLNPTAFPAQSYRTWLPPARRELFVGTPSAISPLRQP